MQRGSLNETITVGNIGEISFLGGPTLATLNISTFFPAQKYSFAKPTYLKPYMFVALINKFKDIGPIRVLITETNINNYFSIENFSYGERDCTGDVYFSLELKEYRKLVADVKDINGNKQQTRPGSKTKPKTYTVKKGDSLFKIAKWWYGDGSKYKELAKKNNLLNTGPLKIGQVLQL